MPDGRDWDDEQLLAALGEAMRARREVPGWFVETGKNAYAWHNIDAELAQLTYDSLGDPLGSPGSPGSPGDRERAAAVRSEAASIRALTFTSTGLSIELEVGEGSLLGQIIPPRAGTARGPYHGRGGQFGGGRDRLLRGHPDPDQPVPATLPHGGRGRRADRVDHAVIPAGSLGPAGQAAPRGTREAAVACWTGSSASPSRAL